MGENETAQQDQTDLTAWPFCSTLELVGQFIADRVLAHGIEQAFGLSIF